MRPGAHFKTVGHNGNQFFGELIKTGLGTYQLGTWNSGAQHPRGNGTLNVRQGLLVAGGGLSSDTARIAALSEFPGFTLKVQDGTEIDFTGTASTINGNLLINNEYVGAGSPVAKVAGYKADYTIMPYGFDSAVGGVGLQTGGTGSTNWSGTLQVAAGTANLNREAGAAVALSATKPAVLKIDAGATANIGGTGDILTDTTVSTRHVSIVNDGQLNITYNNGPAGLTKTAAAVDGTGDLSVLNGATLVTEHVRQDTLVIDFGGSLKIETAGGPAGTSVVNFLSISQSDGSFSWNAGAPAGSGGIAPASVNDAGSVVNAVPEPATWLLLVAAAAVGLLVWRRR